MNMNASASSLNCAVLFERIGPYHFARLSALGRQTRTRAVELFGMDATYAWDKVTGEGGFERETLFENPDAALGDPELINGRVSDALDRSAPALVAIPGWAGTAAFAALSWCLRTGTPAVVMSASTAVDEPRRWWKESLKGQVVRLFSAGLGGGTPHLEYLAALGIPRERLFPGYDVVDDPPRGLRARFLNPTFPLKKKPGSTLLGPGFFTSSWSVQRGSRTVAS
jgi:hypothetical protein